MEGTIKNLIQDKKFGFITVEGREKDLFFHARSLGTDAMTEDEKYQLFDDLKVGDKVSFEEADSPKGPNAVNVAKI